LLLLKAKNEFKKVALSAIESYKILQEREVFRLNQQIESAKFFYETLQNIE
jgi:hypothetical protein